MSGRSRSTSRTVGTNSTARARAVAPVYATRVSPYPAACSKDARASAASTSSSTINMRGIPPRARPSLSSLDCVNGCAATIACSTKAHRARVLVARFEALDLLLGYVVYDAVRLFNLIRKTRAPARNRVEVTAGKPSPVCVHLAPELLPVGLRGIPVHLNLPASSCSTTIAAG